MNYKHIEEQYTLDNRLNYFGLKIISLRYFIRLGFVILCLSFPLTSFAIDIVKINKGRTSIDERTQYKMDILQKALEITQNKYGAFDIQIHGPHTAIKRAMMEVHSGKTINTFMAITTPEWEEKTIPIRIPVRRGILNYRLLSINVAHKDKFLQVNNINDLKKIKAGVREGWATSEVLEQQLFNVFKADTLDGLYYMLLSDRIHYIPRGPNEIYSELASRKKSHPNLIIEPNLALYIPAPYYIFISPKEPKLAKRIEDGLEMMIENGDLKEIFYRYYKERIEQAKLLKRKIIRIGNPLLPINTPLARKELWFENDNQFRSK